MRIRAATFSYEERGFMRDSSAVIDTEESGGSSKDGSARRAEAWAVIPCGRTDDDRDVNQLVIHPASTTHSQLSGDELLDQGIKPNTVRLSIGTEHIDDIIADLEQAFEGK
jgi:hypothetical protein